MEPSGPTIDSITAKNASSNYTMIEIVYNDCKLNCTTTLTQEKFTLGYNSPILQRYPVSSKLLRITNSSGATSQTYIFDRKLTNSGNYVFELNCGKLSSQKKNVSITVNSAPSQLEVYLVGGGDPSSLQLDETYNLHCIAVGYPIPKVHWEFSHCISEMPHCLDESWSTVSSINKEQRLLATYQIRDELAFVAKKIGSYRCVAENGLGTAISEPLEVVPSDIFNAEALQGFNIVTESKKGTIIIEPGQTAYLSCQISKYGFKSFISWSRKLANGVETIIDQHYSSSANYSNPTPDQILRYQTISEFTDEFKLEIRNVAKSDQGIYRCKTQDLNGRDQIRKVKLLVKQGEKPSFSDQKRGDIEVNFNAFELQILSCKADGSPKPKVIWYKNDEVQKETTAELPISPSDSPKAKVTKYTCVVSNKFGSLIRNFQVNNNVADKVEEE